MRLKDHLNKVEYFCIVAEAGSLKKASEKAFIGQPQLTKVIQQLEDIMGQALIVRSPKGISLTKAGNQLYKYSKEILKKVDEAEFLIQSNDEPLEGSVRIGTYDSISRYFFPEFLKYIRMTAPDIKIYLETGRSSVIQKKVKSAELDVGVIVGEAKSSKQMEAKKIYTDSFGLYKSPAISNDFENYLIYFPYPINETEKAMKSFGFNQSIVCDNLETVRSLAEQAIGIGLLPHRVAKESVLSRKLILHRHPKITKNEFDFHDIIMCYSKNAEAKEKNFVISEIERFLQLWSKN